jgi:hypothetical protein
MEKDNGFFALPSGRWRWQITEGPGNAVMELYDRSNPANKMTVAVPFSWRQLSEDDLRELARDPEVRLWTDRAGRFWRISVIGPGTRYDFPLTSRHLLFDSPQCWAGITEFAVPKMLGDLTNEQLRTYRDRIRDLGGRRRRFRSDEPWTIRVH